MLAKHTHTKFGWISSNGLGGNSVTEGRSDGGDCNIPIAQQQQQQQQQPQ